MHTKCAHYHHPYVFLLQVSVILWQPMWSREAPFPAARLWFHRHRLFHGPWRGAIRVCWTDYLHPATKGPGIFAWICYWLFCSKIFMSMDNAFWTIKFILIVNLFIFILKNTSRWFRCILDSLFRKTLQVTIICRELFAYIIRIERRSLDSF